MRYGQRLDCGIHRGPVHGGTCEVCRAMHGERQRRREEKLRVAQERREARARVREEKQAQRGVPLPRQPGGGCLLAQVW